MPLRPSPGKLATSSWAAAPLPAAEGQARRLIGGAALVLPSTALVLLAVVVLALLVGYRTLIVRSGSMAPAIETGDIVVTRLVHPGAVSPGDVVTFRDPTRSLDLVTHRVRTLRHEGQEFAFVTRGDANAGLEEWRIDEGGTMGRMALRIPGGGYPLHWVTIPWVRGILVVGASLVLAAISIRRIWAG